MDSAARAEPRRELREKVAAVLDACRELGLPAAAALEQCWAACPRAPAENPAAAVRLLRQLTECEHAVGEAAAAIQRRPCAPADRPARDRALRCAARAATALAPVAAPAPFACDDCGAALTGAPRCEGGTACRACGREHAAAQWAAEEAPDLPARAEPASHEKSVANYVRRLQGHGREAFALSAKDRAALAACAARAHVTGRNATVRWLRAVLQEVGLSACNEHIPVILQDVFRVTLPQLSGEEERTLVSRINADIRAYLVMKQETNFTGRRQNALPCAYLTYRHLDCMLPPGDPRRQLLKLVHLQERATFERHEEDYWRLCQKIQRRFVSLGPPPREPFLVRPRSKRAAR